MNTGERRFLHVSNLAVAASGIAYAVLKYFGENLGAPIDEFAVSAHPWQPALQATHIVLAPLLVFAVGLIWRSHALTNLAERAPSQRSGLGLMGLFFPMVFSGYLLQISSEPATRTLWITVHLVTSVAWIAASVIHLIHGPTSRSNDAC